MAVRTLAVEPAPAELELEAARLADAGLAGLGYREEELERAARLTWRINRLKAIKRAVIPAHVYQRPEILLGIADYIGDSYKLAKLGAVSGRKRLGVVEILLAQLRLGIVELLD